MRRSWRSWWLLLLGNSGVLACLALFGCSPSNQDRKAEAPPSAAKTEIAPDAFQVNLDTSKGTVEVEVHRDWAPIGVDHFYSLVKLGYYDGNRFFRVTRSYVQFGINGDPKINGLWSMSFVPDDPVKQSNVKGTLTYAHLGANNRTTQLFFNLRNNKDLDKAGFAPIGKITAGMDVVEGLYSSYGDMPPRGQGPDPSKIEVQGNSYLESRFPRLDFIKRAAIR
jgi:peptidyl-prolyl cis-trans isomerase A (cyclophilin A)